MGVLRYSILIDANPVAVWTVWTDLERIPEWQTGSPVLVDATGPGDVVGTSYRVRRGPTTSRTTVLVADPPRRSMSRTDALLGLQFTLAADLVTDGRGTLLSLEARTRWPRGLGLVGRAIEAMVLNPKEATRELENFKGLVEREAGAGA